MPICEEISNQVGALFTCSAVHEYVRVRTPFMYPDGDVIDVFVKERPGDPNRTLTDLGETLRWLRLHTTAQRRTPKQNRLIEDACITHGVELFRGMLMLRARSPENLGQDVARLAQAVLRVSDLWFTFRTREVESITDEVEDLLREREVPFQRAEKHVGRSGRSWNIDFHTRTPNTSSLVNVLSTGSRAAARGIAEHVLATWWDLSQLRQGREALQFVSLFDDTADVWSDQEFRLVEDLSEICRWSRPDEFFAKLAA